MPRSLRSRGGFTLVELMIVVAIIGILAAIALPNFVWFQARSKQSEVRTNLKAIFTGQRSYFAEKDRYVSAMASIGFAPERGNRYTYRLDATCTGLETRTTTPATVTAVSPTCISYDAHRYSNGALNVPVTTPAGAAGAVVMTAVGAGTDVNLAVGNNGSYVGLTAANSWPNGSFAADAFGNIDSDSSLDRWTINSNGSVLTAAECNEGTTAGSNEAAGTPMSVRNDVGCQTPN